MAQAAGRDAGTRLFPGADAGVLAGFVAANLVLKLVLALSGINKGEYTDGILQLLVFQVKAGLYPPLFGALATALSATGLDLETGGRIVSAVAGSLGLIPVYMIALRLRGPCAARYAALFYTVSPMILRWSVRVMTDALFFALCAAALWLMMEAWMAARDAAQRRRADRLLAAATLFAALSALTRYQGALLAPLWLIPAAVFVWRARGLPWRALAASAVWLALPAWMAWNGMVHSQQFRDRSGKDVVNSLLDYLNVAESFVYISPYYLGVPVFVLMVFGAARLDRTRPFARAFIWLSCLWGVAILVLQAMFQSFQYRYMMPVMPAVLSLAGVGAIAFEEHMKARGRKTLCSALMLLGMLYLTVMSCAVLVFQRETFGEQRKAAQYIREFLPPGMPVLSNEQYGPFTDLESVKLTWWSGRPVSIITPYISPDGSHPPERMLPVPCAVVLGDVYGGDPYTVTLTTQLNLYYHMRTVAGYYSTTYPVFDDVMVNPMFNQNPMGWVLRYKAQYFSTQVLVVDSMRTPEEMRELNRRQMVSPEAVGAVERHHAATATETPR